MYIYICMYICIYKYSIIQSLLSSSYQVWSHPCRDSRARPICPNCEPSIRWCSLCIYIINEVDVQVPVNQRESMWISEQDLNHEVGKRKNMYKRGKISENIKSVKNAGNMKCMSTLEFGILLRKQHTTHQVSLSGCSSCSLQFASKTLVLLNL